MAREKKQRCQKCNKIVDEFWSMSEYGVTYYGIPKLEIDIDYCFKCFNLKFGEIQDEKSNNKK